MKALPKYWTLAWMSGLLTMGAVWYAYTLVQIQEVATKNSVTWSNCADLIHKTSLCVQAGGDVSACIDHAENMYKEER